MLTPKIFNAKPKECVTGDDDNEEDGEVRGAIQWCELADRVYLIISVILAKLAPTRPCLQFPHGIFESIQFGSFRPSVLFYKLNPRLSALRNNNEHHPHLPLPPKQNTEPIESQTLQGVKCIANFYDIYIYTCMKVISSYFACMNVISSYIRYEGHHHMKYLPPTYCSSTSSANERSKSVISEVCLSMSYSYRSNAKRHLQVGVH